jgi:MFS family permease
MGVQEENVGFAVGVITGAYSLAQFFSTPLIGFSSDLYGRKLFLLISLVANIVTIVSFAFVTNLWLAVGLRFMQGFFNATTTLARAFLIDISEGSETRTMYLAYVGATHSLARSFSAGFSGISVGIMMILGVSNPYVTPLLIAGGIVSLAICLIVLLPRKRPNQNEVPLEEHHLQSEILSGIKELFSNWLRVRISIMIALSQFANGSATTLLVLFTDELILHYGLEFSTLSTGIVFMIYGLLGFLFELVALHPIVHRLGSRKTYLLGAISSAFYISLLPCASMPYWFNQFQPSVSTTVIAWILLILILAVGSIGKMTLMPTLHGILANVHDIHKQGLVQGASHSIQAAAKSVGPLIAGSFFAFSVKRIV